MSPTDAKTADSKPPASQDQGDKGSREAQHGGRRRRRGSRGHKSRGHKSRGRRTAHRRSKAHKKHGKKHHTKKHRKGRKGKGRKGKRGGSVVGTAALPFGLLALQKFFQTRKGRKDLKKMSKTVRKSVRKVSKSL